MTERCHLDVALRGKANPITQDSAFLRKDRTAKERVSFRKTDHVYEAEMSADKNKTLNMMAGF